MRKKRKYTRNPTFCKQIDHELTMNEMFEQFMFIKKSEGLAPRTIKEYYVNYEYFLDYTEGDLSKDQMTTELFCGWIDYMKEELDLAPATINIRIRTMRAFARYIYEEKRWINEPIHKRFKPIKSPIDVVEALDTDEVKQIIGCIDDHTYVGFRTKVIIYVLLDTMIRVSELINIKKSDIDLKSGTIHIKADNTKTRVGRLVPISSKTIRLLKEYMLETEEFDNDYLFLTYEGERISISTVRENIALYGKVAGIKNKRVSPHVFRHTGALFYILAGGDPFSLQKILGHSHMNMVRRYIQMTNVDIQDQHNHYSPINKIFQP